MISVTDLAAKATGLLGRAVTRKTKVYSPHKNKIVVAGFTLDGVEEIVLSADQITKQEQGIDPSYYAYYDSFENKTIQITTLSTARCVDILKTLQATQRREKGWVTLSLYENGELLGNFKAHLISIGDRGMSQDAPSRTFTFGVQDKETQIVSVLLTQTT